MKNRRCGQVLRYEHVAPGLFTEVLSERPFRLLEVFLGRPRTIHRLWWSILNKPDQGGLAVDAPPTAIKVVLAMWRARVDAVIEKILMRRMDPKLVPGCLMPGQA